MSPYEKEQDFYERRRCCGTCRYHCENPLNSKTTINNTWLCGNPDGPIGHTRKYDSGTTCKFYAKRKDGSEFLSTHNMLVRRKINRRGKLEWLNLTTIADEVYNKYINLLRTFNDVDISLAIAANEFNIRVKDVKKCLQYKEVTSNE